MAASRDENLLFGALALQMDFVSGDALLKAMNLWLLEKTRPLSLLLVESGAMSAANRDVLDQVVAAHLRTHRNDPTESLAACLQGRDIASVLLALDDEDVRQSLQVPSGRPVPERQRDAAPEFLTGVVGRSSADHRFTILRPHAQGGVGEVFVARDTELNRDVALKELRALRDEEDDLRLRFRLEAEITGGLEHPGIVPVYGFGSYPDGRLFYAMRFIEGRTLRSAIQDFHRSDASAADRNLVFRDLIQRLVQVCQAVSYAHSRGILHRDLKPDNVMLGSFGETLVVDWGLARVIGAESQPTDGAALPASARPLRPRSGSDASPTIDGAVIGTPHYMSPEQAAGELRNLGPASDVYSLGAILHEILTNEPPHPVVRTAEGSLDLGAMLSAIREGRIHRDPRTTNREIPEPLAAVCRHALAPRPAQRYASANALAADLERWLGDEPVSVLSEPAALRLRRWIRRHPRFVTGLASTLLLGTLSGLLIAAVVTGKNRELTQVNTELEVAAREARAARDTAAERQRDAERSARLALQTINLVVDELPRRLGSLPSSDTIEAEILARTVPNLEQLSRLSLDRENVDRELISALNRTADAVQNLSVAPAAATSLSDSEADSSGPAVAVRLRRRALELARSDAARHGDDPRVQQRLRYAWQNLGTSLQHAGRSGEAADANREAIRLIEGELATDPDNRKLQDDLIFCVQQLGDAVRIDEGTPAAREHYLRYRNLVQDFVASAPDPDDPDLQMSLALAHERVALVHETVGELEPALARLRDSLRAAQTAAERDPEDLYVRRHIALTHGNIGRVLLNLGRVEEGGSPIRTGLRQAVQLAHDAPSNVRALEVVSGLLPMFEHLRSAGDVRPDDDELWSDLLDAFVSDNVSGQSAAAYWKVHYDAGMAQLANGRPQSACRFLTTAVQSAARLRDVLDRESRPHAGQTQIRREAERALDTLNRIPAAITEQHWQPDPKFNVSGGPFDLLSRMGILQRAAHRTAAAEQTFRQLREFARPSAVEPTTESDPAPKWLRRIHAVASIQLARTLRRRGRFDESRELFRQSLDEFRALNDGTDNRAIQDLAACLAHTIASDARHQQFEEARQRLQEYNALDVPTSDSNTGTTDTTAGLPTAESLRSLIADTETAVGSLDALLDHPASHVPRLLALRVESFVAAGDEPAAIDAADRLVGLPAEAVGPSEATRFVDVARLLSTARSPVSSDSRPADDASTPDESAPHESAAAHRRRLAVALLEHAVAAGWRDIDRLRHDPALQPLHDTEVARKLLDGRPPSPNSDTE